MPRTPVKRPLNTVPLTFDEAISSSNLIGGGRFQSAAITLDGIGVDSSTTGTWASLGVTADHSGLLTQGSIRLDINADYLPGGLDASNNEIAAVNEGLLTSFFVNRDGAEADRGNAVLDAQGNIDSQLRLSPAAAVYQHANLNVAWRGKGAWVPFVQQWSSAGKFQTIVDGLVIAETDIGTYDWGSSDMDPFDVRDPTSSSDPDLARNVVLLDQFIDSGSSRISVGFVGDSLPNFGAFPDWMWSDRPAQAPDWIPLTNAFSTAGPKGIDGANGAALESVNGKHYDAGCLTTIFRELHKRGFYTANNLNFTSGGATTAQIVTNLNNLLSVRVPDVIFANAGTNDANDGASFDATAQATFETNLKLLISNAYNAGVRQVCLSNLHSLQNNSSFSDAVYALNVDICNRIIAALPAWAALQGFGADFVRVADNFTAFGGHDFDVNKFITNDVHHQTFGSWTFGKTLADVATSRILGRRARAGLRMAA